MTLLEEIDAIREEAKRRENMLTTNMKQCRYCNQWYNRRTQTIQLFGYCSVSCLEIDYATFRHMKMKAAEDTDV